MAQIINSDIIQDIVKQGQLQNSAGVSTTINPVISPVMEVGRNSKIANIVKGGTAASGTITVYTTPANKDFYLCSASLSRCHIVTDNGTYTQLLGTPFEINTSTALLFIAGATLTADMQTISINYPRPILLKRGTNISVTDGGTYTMAAADITGFTVEEH